MPFPKTLARGGCKLRTRRQVLRLMGVADFLQLTES